ncbi:MAG: tetratricopeptide repeat protein, partial [Candidatus Omnitrophota bacterium]
GTVNYEKMKLDQAIADYSKAIQIEPNLALTYYNLGNAYKELGILDQAIADYSKAIQIEPKLAGAYFNRAAAYFMKHQYAKSWEDVGMLKALGYAADSKFIKKLQEVSGLKE